MIEIINAGMLSTVQDLGRVGVMKNGFTQNGVMDSYSAKIANRLCGNCLEAPVIEMTMLGITARFSKDCVICLSGGNFVSTLNDMPIKTNKAYKVKNGDVLAVDSAQTGARSYLAVSGGIAVPQVMSSASTDLKSNLGGYFGRKLKKGDCLPIGTGAFNLENIEKWQINENQYHPSNNIIRAVLGPQDYMFTDEDLKLFFGQEYTVSSQADRMGIRLDGKKLCGKDGMDIISDGIVFGSVQVSNSGMPIVLMADHQTTGGYAKIATVISVDLPKLAQMKPGDKLKFVKVSVEQAEKVAKKEKKFFDDLYMF